MRRPLVSLVAVYFTAEKLLQVQQAKQDGDQPTPPASPEGRPRPRAASLRA